MEEYPGPIGAWLAVITFFASYYYCAVEYGYLLGVGLGWLPSIIVATAVFFLWPLLVLVAIVVFVLIKMGIG